MYKQVKRYNCTVSDKRGFQGECMEYSESGKFITYESHLECVKFFTKKEERKKVGLSKLLKALNERKPVQITEHTIAWLQDCGFQLKTVPVPYTGSLPVEDRILLFNVSLED